MKYKGTYFNMWDAWYLNVDDTIHSFHLKSHPGENWNVGHVCTKDLLHFTKLRDVLETLPEEKYPDDCLGKFTGCAVEKDGIYYLFYTMRDRFRSEKIGLATSTDLEHFTEYENNPVFDLDKALFIVREKGERTDCRDLFVIYDKERKKYFGYFVAMANIQDRGELGVVGVIESTDLLHWEKQKIVYIPEFNGIVEVPNVFKMDGKWYMTLMTSSQYGAKGAVSDSNLNSYIISTSSNAPNEVFRRSVQVGQKFFLDSPFDFNGITGGVDDSDELIHGLALVIKAQLLPHGQVVADLCVVSFFMKLQLRDTFHQFLLLAIQFTHTFADVAEEDIVGSSHAVHQ